MGKLDLRKSFKQFYAPASGKVDIVDIPEFSFAMIDGIIEDDLGPSTSPAFQEALQALYGISYALKFSSKKRQVNPVDYSVMPLEALWWVENGEFEITRPAGWKWTAMILQPEHITPEMFFDAQSALFKKRETQAVNQLRLELFREGLCVQTLHVGPYSAESATISRMHQFAREHELNLRGRHHEIYLGDPRRADPEKLKTILRQPVE